MYADVKKRLAFTGYVRLAPGVGLKLGSDPWPSSTLTKISLSAVRNARSSAAVLTLTVANDNTVLPSAVHWPWVSTNTALYRSQCWNQVTSQSASAQNLVDHPPASKADRSKPASSLPRMRMRCNGQSTSAVQWEEHQCRAMGRASVACKRATKKHGGSAIMGERQQSGSG
jgi:hypothetical protein